MFRSVKNRRFFPQAPWTGLCRFETYDLIQDIGHCDVPLCEQWLEIESP